MHLNSLDEFKCFLYVLEGSLPEYTEVLLNNLPCAKVFLPIASSHKCFFLYVTKGQNLYTLEYLVRNYSSNILRIVLKCVETFIEGECCDLLSSSSTNVAI